MVKKPDIQYIDRFYVHGSEARVVELKPKRRLIKTILPAAAPDHSIRIFVDPVAICGIVVAVALLAMLIVGTMQYVQSSRRHQAMMDYVVTVQNENVALRDQYRSRIDLEQIEQRALEMGMIPLAEAEVITISGVLPVKEPEKTPWEEFIWLCEGLFA